MLPTVTVKTDIKSRKVRCLIDTGSQTSCISEVAARDLCPDVNKLFSLDCDVGTYIGAETKGFKQKYRDQVRRSYHFCSLIVGH